MARIYVGTFPTGVDATFVDGVDPAALMLREASAALDRERAEAEKARLAQIATRPERGTPGWRERVAVFRRRWRYVGSAKARRGG